MWSVHKFGGTSVGNIERIKASAQLIIKSKSNSRMAIVVSAIKGVTDSLVNLCEDARKKNENWKIDLNNLKELHNVTLRSLCNETLYNTYWPLIVKDFSEVEEILSSVSLVQSTSMAIVEKVSGLGEVWSAQILNAHLLFLKQNSSWLDAREVLIVESSEHVAEVQWEVSEKNVIEKLKEIKSEILVITGFVAKTKQNVATTLKRNGSDYSASIFAYLLKAKELTIWTDVDGVMSADPRLVPEAMVMAEMSYQEVIELAYFGAKVVHPKTMLPAMNLGIPILIKNSFNPSAPGTVICEKTKNLDGNIIRGFSIIENMCLMNLEGTGMMGIPGVAEKLFGVLRSEKINVVLISQASSEHSICFAIHQLDADKAKKCIEQTFYGEIQQKAIERIDINRSVSILAAVGDGMCNMPGIAGKFLSALGKAQVNISAIAQGSSERNISVVISGVDGTKALRAVHAAFYLSQHTLAIGIIGNGLIGGTFIEQLKIQLNFLRKEKNIDIKVRAITNSKKMYLAENDCLKENDLKEIDFNLDQFLNHVKQSYIPHFAIVDATASNELPKEYVNWMIKGFHIITPNKKGLSSSIEQYKAIKETSNKFNRQFLYSTNVGAGLPIINTVRELVQTGDKIESIEAVLSGTLSFIFNNLKDSFANQVREAMKLGFTEPDPRDDLSGMDVLRKMTIIMREIGLDVQGVVPMNLVPENLQKMSKEEFINRLDEIEIKVPEGQILRYVASFENGEIKVGLKAFTKDSPMAGLQYADNILIVKSERYKTRPLVIQGPGAGPAVTAGGVFADLLRLMNAIGATL